jgi:hypothetical protein
MTTQLGGPRIGSRAFATAVIIALLITALPAGAERPEPTIFTEIDGDPVYTVLAPDAIPSIRTPSFVTGAEAAAQMNPDEPVIGVVIDGEAHAYSTWQLDAHEIVNDRIAGSAIAATW